MLVQNKLTKKYGLVSKVNKFFSIDYEDGERILCSKSNFYKDFIRIDRITDKVLVYKVNGAYFINKWDADWQINFLKRNGYSVKKGFMYDTIKNIMERISHV